MRTGSSVCSLSIASRSGWAGLGPTCALCRASVGIRRYRIAAPVESWRAKRSGAEASLSGVLGLWFEAARGRSPVVLVGMQVQCGTHAAHQADTEKSNVSASTDENSQEPGPSSQLSGPAPAKC